MSRLSPARRVAAEAGAQVRLRGAYTSDVLESLLGKRRLSPEDAAFARVLALGVCQMSGTLDETIDRCLNAPTDVFDDVRDCLRVSCYELLFLDKQPHAAVDQGVELVRAVQPKAARLANAVLHRMLAARESFPYGDPSRDPAAFARSKGFPLWLSGQLQLWLGRDDAQRFMGASNAPAPVFFGVNSIRMQDESELVSQMKQAGILLDPVRLGGARAAVSGCYHASKPEAVAVPAVRRMIGEGKLLVSDAAAQAVVKIALPRTRPRRFLEVGSGRGTKTILLQSEAHRRWGDQLELHALDVHGFKADLLRERAAAYGVRLEGTVSADARKLPAPGADGDELGLFDAVLVDSPCSGLGTLRRHPEIRWRLRPEQIEQLAELSLQIMRGVAPHVAPGGQIVYSTCTVSPQENEYLVKRFLESPEGAGFKIKSCSVNGLSKLFFKTRLVEGGCDAHFAALLVRSDAS